MTILASAGEILALVSDHDTMGSQVNYYALVKDIIAEDASSRSEAIRSVRTKSDGSFDVTEGAYDLALDTRYYGVYRIIKAPRSSVWLATPSIEGSHALALTQSGYASLETTQADRYASMRVVSADRIREVSVGMEEITGIVPLVPVPTGVYPDASYIDSDGNFRLYRGEFCRLGIDTEIWECISSLNPLNHAMSQNEIDARLGNGTTTGTYLDTCNWCGERINDGVSFFPINEFAGHTPHYNRDRVFCEGCLSRMPMGECEACHGITREENLVAGRFCSGDCAASVGLVSCSNCGGYFDEDDITDSGMCSRCDNAVRYNIGGYHSHNKTAQFFGNDTDPYFGIEIEIDGDIDEDANHFTWKWIKDSFPDKSIYAEYDGSLDCGFEIITAPMTCSWIADNKHLFTGMMGVVEENGYEDYKDGAGIHIHVGNKAFGEFSTEQDYNLTKLLLLVERFWEDIASMSGRESSWGEPYYDKNVASLSDKVKNKAYQERYRAVNITNGSTVEFRMFQSVLSPYTIFGYIALVDTLVRAAKSMEVREIDTESSLSDIIGRFNTGALSEYIDNTYC